MSDEKDILDQDDQVTKGRSIQAPENKVGYQHLNYHLNYLERYTECIVDKAKKVVRVPDGFKRNAFPIACDSIANAGYTFAYLADGREEEAEYLDDLDKDKEAVDHPDHYNKGNIEDIDYIEDKKLGFCLGNVVKYIGRADHKGAAIEDLEKALWYLTRELERRKGTLITTTEKNYATTTEKED